MPKTGAVVRIERAQGMARNPFPVRLSSTESDLREGVSESEEEERRDGEPRHAARGLQ